MPLKAIESMMHKIYLPFTEDKLRSHFARVKQKGECVSTHQSHIAYYRRSVGYYNEYSPKNENRKGEPISKMKVPCQIEKDERFWIAACLMTVFHSKNRTREFVRLFEQAYGNDPPIKGITSWEDCFNGELHLFFEPNLPSPKPYSQWLSENQTRRHFIPYILAGAHGKTNLEGPTNADAMILNSTNGFAVIVEAKVLSDISCQITYDALRNQIARNIDVMLEKNENLCHPLKKRIPESTLFLLITPQFFKSDRTSRLYGYKFDEYKNNPDSLAKDLPHRSKGELQGISQKLGWLTWEDFRHVNSACCKWLETT